jgi:hypothetical protein
MQDDALEEQMTNNWLTFWSNYGPECAVTEEDLFRQVAQTWGKRPISKELFQRMLDYIEARLQLSRADHLLDFCCGNGLVSHPYMTDNAESLRKQLIENKIYVPIYWPELKTSSELSEFESRFVRQIVCLPIDQRYGSEDMMGIANFLKENS